MVRKQRITPQQLACKHIFTGWKIELVKTKTPTRRYLWQRLCRECGYMEMTVRSPNERS